MTRRLACLLSTLALVACSGLDSFYDKDYVMYDSEQARQQQEARQKAAAEQAAAEKPSPEQAAEPKEHGGVGADTAQTAEPGQAGSEPAGVAPTGDAATGTAATGAAAKAADSASEPTAKPPPADPVIARIVVLESVLDELNRAIRDGVPGLGDKRNEVERELAWRKEQAGTAWPAAQQERFAELRAFPTYPPPPEHAK